MEAHNRPLSADNLPPHAILAFKNHGVGDIIICAAADAISRSVFRDVFLALTDTGLYVLYGRAEGPIAFAGAGYFEKKKRRKETQWLEEGFIKYDGTGELQSIETISGRLLALKQNDELTQVCYFTGSKTQEILHFVTLYNKRREGKELTDDDFLSNSEPRSCPKCGMIYPDQGRAVCPRCVDKRGILVRLLGLLKPYRTKWAIMLFCMLASAGLGVVSPYLTGKILIDQVLTPPAPGFGEYYGQILPLIGAILGVRLLALGFSVCYGRINAVVTAKLILSIKQSVFANMQKLSLSYYNREQTGRLMNRIIRDSHELQYFFNDGVPYFIVNILTIALILVMAVSINAWLAMWIFFPLLFIFVALKIVYPKLFRLHRRRWRKGAALNSLVNDSLKGQRVVKAFGKEQAEMGRFAKASGDVFTAQRNLGIYNANVWPFLELLVQSIGLLIWGVGGFFILSGNMTYGDLVTFSGMLAMLIGPLDFMTYVAYWWSDAAADAARIFEIQDAVSEVPEPLSPANIGRIDGDITLQNVTFGYAPGKYVLKDVSFSVKAGEVLGIVGKSGAGKTTLINLVSRFYDTGEGRVLIDGTDVRDISSSDMRGQVAVVSQESYIFMGTVAENIDYSHKGATREQIIQAAKAAGAHDFIEKMPEGYDTRIGTGGRELSGGERQRVSIARAILLNPRILILDEATSAVDTATEKVIQEALESLAKGRTVLSIAHRLSTLRNADHLIVLEDGKIAESGTHMELIRNKGPYYNLVQKQNEALKFKGVSDDEAS